MQISGIISTFLYILLGVFLAVGINSGLVLALSTDMPVVAVESNSMSPTFERGDMLVLQGYPVEQLEIGDIIVFSPSENKIPIVHRIVEINPDGSVQTKGDANSRQLSFEKYITSEQIHGKVVFIVPYIGWIKIGVTEYLIPNLMWIILVFIMAYLISEVYGKIIKNR